MARRGWLSTQPKDFRTAIIGPGRIRHLRRGEFLCHEGDAHGGIFGVIAGGIGVIMSRPTGDIGLAGIFRAGDWFGGGPLHGSVRVVSACATEPSVVLSVELRDLDAIAADDPEARRRYGSMTALNAGYAVRVIAELALPDADRRIAATLLRCTAVLDGVAPPGKRGFMITQSQLGEMANASRNSVNRTLKLFESRGWVKLSYNHIAIADAAGLNEFATAER